MNDGRVRARDAAAGAVAAPPSPVTPLGSLVNITLRLRALIALVVLVAAFALLSPEFLTTGNVTILIKHVAINAILAMGMTFVILTGGIDLSVGSVAGLVGMIAGGLISQGLVLESLAARGESPSAFDERSILVAYVAPPSNTGGILGRRALSARRLARLGATPDFHHGLLGSVVYLHTWLVVVIGLAAGMACGALNGLLVARLGVAPFIATLGVLYIARGAALLVSGGATFPNLGGSAELGNTGFPWLGGGVLLGLPVPIWVMGVLALVAAFVATRTPFGRRVYAIGGNERAALLSGVRVRRVKVGVYVISGFCAGLVGLVIASQLGAAHPATGETFELNAIAAVVLGGTSLMGGRGTIGGTLIGAFVIGVLADGLVLLGISEFWQVLIKGLVIVLAVILDQFQKARFQNDQFQTRSS